MHNWQQYFHETIVEHCRRLQTEDPSLSLRKIAKKGLISPGSLSQLLNNRPKWNLSPAKAMEILRNLEVDENRRNYLAALTGGEIALSRTPVPTEDYGILKDWVYIPVLVSFDLSPRPTPNELAKKLSVDVGRIESAIEFLLSRGYLKKEADGTICRHSDHWDVAGGPPNEAIRLHHRSGLEVAAKALDEVPAERRYFTSIVFAGNRENIEYVKEEIEKLLARASAIMEKTPPSNELFKLSVNLFPLDFG